MSEKPRLITVKTDQIPESSCYAKTFHRKF